MKLSHNVKKSDIKKRPLRAVIYIRVSTLTQKKDGHGLEGQLEACMKTIENKKLVYVGKYTDGAVSGTRLVETRDGLKRLYEDSTKNIFDTVVVYKVDRLGRSMKIIMDVIDYFNQNNIKIISCTEDVDTTKSSGLMTVQMFAVIAEYEKSTIGERLMVGREMVLQERGETGGKLPYGYKRAEGKKLEISEEYGKIVQYIFDKHKNGYSAIKIADRLNLKGIIPKKAKRWWDASVGVILKNRKKYEGSNRNNNQGMIRWPVIIYDQVMLNLVEIDEIIFAKNVTVAVYVRSSCIEKSFYLKQQEEEIDKLITEKNWNKYKLYSDINSENNNREGLNQLLQDCEKNLFSIIIVKDLSRLGTTLNKLSDIFIPFLNSEIKLISLYDIQQQKNIREEQKINEKNFASYINPLNTNFPLSDSENE